MLLTYLRPNNLTCKPQNQNPFLKLIFFPIIPFAHHFAATKTVSFDETMKEKESSGGRRLRRRRRGKRKHHHSGRRDHRHHRNHRSPHYRSKSNSDDEDDEEESDCSSCSSCTSSSCSDSSCSSCFSSSSSDEDAGDLQWPAHPKHITAGTNQSSQHQRAPMPSDGSGDATRSSRQTRTPGSQLQQFLTSSASSTGTGSLTRPPPLRPDIKRQPNTACLIQ